MCWASDGGSGARRRRGRIVHRRRGGREGLSWPPGTERRALYRQTRWIGKTLPDRRSRPLAADGELDLLGRADDQIKINGIRIEPGEIEATLLTQVPGIAAAVVTLFEDTSGVRRLAAYLVRHFESGDQRPTMCVQHCAAVALQHGADALRLVRRDAADAERQARPKGAARARLTTPRPCGRPIRLQPNWSGRSPRSGRSCCKFRRSARDQTSSILAAIRSPWSTCSPAIEAKFGRALTVDVLAGGLTVAGLAQVL